MPTSPSGGGHVSVTTRWRIPAGRPKAGQPLSEAQQRRYVRAGLTKAEYESGAKVTAARGHATTPEHGIKDAARNPEKYQDYLRRRPTGSQLPTIDREALEDAALENRDIRTGHYFKYNRNAVIQRIRNMTIRELQTAAQATEDQLTTLAAAQRKNNPWHYH